MFGETAQIKLEFVNAPGDYSLSSTWKIEILIGGTVILFGFESLRIFKEIGGLYNVRLSSSKSSCVKKKKQFERLIYRIQYE